MRLKGLKKASSELKSVQNANIYLNIETGEVLVMTYPGQGGCSYVGHDYVKLVCEYNYRYDQPTMKWIKEQVEEYIHLHGLDRSEMAEEIIDRIDFTEEEYAERVNKGDATFIEFIEGIVKIVNDNNGSIEDGVFIANDAFRQF